LRLWAPAGSRGGVARDVRGLAALLAHAFGPAALQARTRTRPWRRAAGRPRARGRHLCSPAPLVRRHPPLRSRCC
jgi:hypothetical protein